MLVHKNKWRKIKKENEYEKTICPVLYLIASLGSSMPVGAFAEGNNLVAENSSVAETTEKQQLLKPLKRQRLVKQQKRQKN